MLLQHDKTYNAFNSGLGRNISTVKPRLLSLLIQVSSGDVMVELFDEACVTQPTLAEIEARWKPMRAAHLQGEATEQEESQ